jgi:hypothetical protein
MRLGNAARKLIAPVRRPETNEESQQLGDLRFRALLTAEEWALLPAAVRRRFSKRLAHGATAIYCGRVTAFHASRAGRLLARVLRIVGAPLPLFDDVDVPTVVTVSEDARNGGQNWSRLYANRSGFPQVIHSSKRFAGPTGLEEYIGCGVSMALRVHAEPRGLRFESAGYALRLGWLRMPVPAWLSPGDLTVTHYECEADRFTFEMTLRHRRLGLLMRQTAVYGDVAS